MGLVGVSHRWGPFLDNDEKVFEFEPESESQKEDAYMHPVLHASIHHVLTLDETYPAGLQVVVCSV